MPEDGVEERLAKMAAQRDEARRELASAKAEAAEARLAKTAAEAELSPLRDASKAWASERAFLGAGLTDPDAQLVARTFHERIPEAERPALDAWLASLKADPTKAPKALAPYLGTPAVNGTQTATQAGQTQAARAQATNARTETVAAAGVPTSVDTLRAAYATAVRTNVWTEYDALAASVTAEYDGPKR